MTHIATIAKQLKTEAQGQPSTPNPPMTLELTSTSIPTADDYPPDYRPPSVAQWAEKNNIELCPECHTMQNEGVYRQDVPVRHPNFGKLVKCTDPFHAEARAERMQTISQLGPEDISRRLSDIGITPKNREAIEAARETIAQGYGWLYIWGGPGNAKSEILKAIVNELNEAGRGPAMYTRFGTILDYMRDSFGGNGNYLERFNQVKNIRVLAIDEMDKPKESEWANDFRFHFLDDRYIQATNRQGLTVFAGQPHPKDIFDDVVYDRFRDGRFKIVHNAAPSARPNMRW